MHMLRQKRNERSIDFGGENQIEIWFTKTERHRESGETDRQTDRQKHSGQTADGMGQIQSKKEKEKQRERGKEKEKEKQMEKE